LYQFISDSAFDSIHIAIISALLNNDGKIRETTP
jgi:hypothetical protein